MKKNLLSFALLLISIGQLFAQNCINCDTSKQINKSLQLCIPVEGSISDQSPTSNTVYSNGVQLSLNRKGLNNSSISFDGLDDYITVPDLFDFPNRTYSIWFNPTTIGTREDLIISDHPNLVNDFTLISLQEKQGTDKIVFYAGTATYEETISTNIWHHAAITVNGDQVSFFLNGTKRFTTTKGPLNSVDGSPNLVLGAARDMTDYYYHGLMDEIRVYSRTLSDSEINLIYLDSCNFPTNCLNCDSVFTINQNLNLCIPVTGNTVDESRFNYSLNINGTQLAANRNGINNSAISFDGSDDYITVPDLFDFPNRTYSIWFNPTTIGTREDLIISDHPNLVNDFTLISLQEKQGTDKIVFYAGTATYEETISTNIWHHAAITVNGDQVSFFLNGTKRFTTTKGPFNSVDGSPNLVLGAARDMTDYYYHGLMDEIRVYSRTLSDSEISLIYLDSCNFPTKCLNCDSVFTINQNLNLCVPVTSSIVDESRFNYSLNINGTQLAANRNGINNSAISFDGSDDYITVPDLFDFPNRTFSIWFNPTTIGTREDLIISDHPNLVNDFTLISLQEKQGTNKIVFYAGTATYEETISTNIWHHAAITVNGDQVSFFLNGTKRFTTTKGPLNSVDGSPNLVLGAARDMTDYYYHGLMDEIRVYSRTLSDSEINFIYSDSCNVNEDSIYNFNKNNPQLNNLETNNNEIKIYPNPTNSKIKIETNQSLDKIQLISITGSLIYEIDNPGMLNIIDVSLFKSGVYLIKIIDVKKQSLTRKIMIY